jgi:hypothetical protein
MPKRREDLSQKPSQIRNRLRRSQGRVQKDVDLYFEVRGGRPIEEWDLEELSRGRPRAKDGTFKGRTPAWITPTVVKEAKRRLLDHTIGQMAGHVDLAVNTIKKLLTDNSLDDNGRPMVDARTKLAAAQYVIDHIAGKPKIIAEIDASDTVRQFLASALVVDDDGTPAHPVIDGQFYEEESTDDDDDE